LVPFSGKNVYNLLTKGGLQLPDDKAKELIEEKCGLCHTSDYATGTTNTAGEWRETVMRMKDDNGADLTEKEAEAIIGYLSRHHGR
jgi:hypothetical protein